MEAGKAAFTALDDACEIPDRELRGATARVAKAARIALEGAAETLLGEAADLHGRYLNKIAALLIVEGALDRFDGGELTDRTRSALAGASHDDCRKLAIRTRVYDDWRLSLERLAVSADTPLLPS